MKKNILLFALSSLLSILAAEVFIGIVSPQISEHDNMFTHDPELGWAFVPNKEGIIIHSNDVKHHIRTNQIGFRDTPIDSNSRAKKILVLGDSFVSNISVSKNDVFTEVMEQNMPNYDVLNFGVNGYGQVQEYLLAQKWLPIIKPDFLIVLVYIRNDFIDNTGDLDWLYSRPYASLNQKNIIEFKFPDNQTTRQPDQVTPKASSTAFIYITLFKLDYTISDYLKTTEP